VAGRPPAPRTGEAVPTLEQAERDLIALALQRCDGDKDLAARVLGLTLRTLYRRLKKHGLA
jgi:DNA-binding NtrC family response regulator